MVTLHSVLMILAAVAFFLAAWDVKFYRVNLTPMGLFFWILAEVVMGR